MLCNYFFSAMFLTTVVSIDCSGNTTEVLLHYRTHLARFFTVHVQFSAKSRVQALAYTLRLVLTKR